MAKQKYRINKTWDGVYGEEIYFDGILELDDKVIKAVDDEWRKMFYPSLKTPQDIADHIVYNIIVNDATLSQLDGFANLPDSFAEIIREK